MRIRSTREHRILVIKTSVRWLLYYLVIFISFLIMTSGTLLKPILLVPIAICIAIDNNQYASVLTGAVCGFLIDISCGKLFGYNAVFVYLVIALINRFLMPKEHLTIEEAIKSN